MQVAPVSQSMSSEEELHIKCRRCACLSIVALIDIIVTISCVASSYHYVSYDEMAFKRAVYGSVDTSVIYNQGRYFMPLTYSVVRFPAVYQPIVFLLSVFSDNGLEFDVSVSFQYKLPPNSLADIYNKYSTNYESLVISVSKAAIKNTATLFGVEDYLSNRTYIENKFAVAVHGKLSEIVWVDAPTQFFKIISIHFPGSLIDKSLQTVVTLQNNELLLAQQQLSVINAETDSIIAAIDAQTTLTLAYATNTATQTVNESQNKAKRLMVNARGQGIATFLSLLGFNSTDTAMCVENRDEIIRILSIGENINATILFGTIATSASANLLLHKTI